MHIEIAPETEFLVRQEMSAGNFRSVDELIRAGVNALHQISAAQVPDLHSKTTGQSKTTGEEKARAFGEWARSHRDTPLLSDEAISRAALNPDRW